MSKESCMNLNSNFPNDFNSEKDNIHAIIRDHWLNFDYVINNNRTIDVTGDVVFPEFASFLSELPLRFNKVSGNFDCSALENLTSLKGGPLKIDGAFNCAFTKITSLEYAPESADVLIFDNNIKSLSTGDRNCHFNKVHMLMTNSSAVKSLPHEIINNKEYFPLILKYQNYFGVWNHDGAFNIEGFNMLITEIKEGLK
jgi:hypothetical protein